MSSRGESGIGGSPSAFWSVRYRQRQGRITTVDGDEWVSGGKRKIEWPERPVADRGPRGYWGNARLGGAPISYRSSSRKHKMSEAKFDKAVKIVQSLPKDGPIKPTQDDQLYVRTPVFFISGLPDPNPYLATPQPAVLQLLQARCVLQGAIAGMIGPHLPGPFESSHYRRRQHRETRNVGLYG
jgi:hypothetical protein